MTEFPPDQPIVEALSMSYGPPGECRFDRIVVSHDNPELRRISECTAGLVAWMVARDGRQHIAALNEAANTIKIYPPLELEPTEIVLGAVAKNTGTELSRLIDRNGMQIVRHKGVWIRTHMPEPPAPPTS